MVRPEIKCSAKKLILEVWNQGGVDLKVKLVYFQGGKEGDLEQRIPSSILFLYIHSSADIFSFKLFMSDIEMKIACIIPMWAVWSQPGHDALLISRDLHPELQIVLQDIVEFHILIAERRIPCTFFMGGESKTQIRWQTCLQAVSRSGPPTWSSFWELTSSFQSVQLPDLTLTEWPFNS